MGNLHHILVKYSELENYRFKLLSYCYFCIESIFSDKLFHTLPPLRPGEEQL